ncbi:MAG TPA: PhzF family phenazine biosynthesis protein, partial [Vicinamibacterales bacterium]|nr:PhzF family phenazine biosynthesis protein [Vicinamibacterales bacterium]
MPTVPFSHVDAFTTVPFRGNPAVVCRIDEWPPNDWMQNVAREMNAGATVFVRTVGERTELRWFSPTVELVLCGHGTLAASHLLWETGARPRAQSITYETKDGQLSARCDGDRV